MRRVLVAVLALLVSTAAFAAGIQLPANVAEVETYRGITQYRLKSNDMTILLVPDHTSPVFTFMVVYHVGSRNEAPGNTGSAHLLEHMIFNKSTENFGKANGHKTFQEVLFEAGADYSSTNMTTWYDRMNGYSTLPSDKLDLAMKIEADRLGRGLILDSERQSEMSVVRNEYEIGENNPGQALFKAVVGTAIQAHPYHWDTIGYRSDIEGVTTEKLREHYKNYFWPNNSEAILVGDFDPQVALAMFDREFGGFARSAKPIPAVITVEPPQEGERRVVVSRPGSVGLVLLGYVRPGALDPDFIPLDVLAAILNGGVNARMHRALVESGLATDVSVDNFTLKDPYPFLVQATVAPGKTQQQVEDAIKKTLADVARDGVTDDELKRAQQQIEVEVIRSRDGTYNYASNLGESVASTNWKWFLGYVDAMKAVTAADVKRVATRYFVPEHATVGWFVPLAASPRTAESAPPPAAPAATVVAAEPKSNARAEQRAAAAVTQKSFAARTTRRLLKNGIILDVVETHSLPTVAIRGVVLAGDSAAPAGKPALPQLTAAMLDRGTRSRTKEQIGDLLERAGASRSYGASLTEATISANGMARDLPLLLDVLSEEMRDPAFRAEEIDKAKKELESSILQADESTGARAMQRLAQVVYAKGHPYRPAGRQEMLASLSALTVEDLRAFHAARYSGSNLILAIVGDVDTNRTIAAVEKAFGSIGKGQRTTFDGTARTAPGDSPVREVVTLHGKANMNIVMGTASGLRRTDADYNAALIGNAALGQSSLASRIGKRVRDTEGLSYALSSRFGMSDMLDGLWYVNVNVAPQNLAKAIRSTREVIDQFAAEGVTDEEVAVQKSFFAGNYQVGLGSNGGIASALVSAEKFGFGPQFLDTFPVRIRAVTKEEVNAAMKAHFAAGKLHLIVAGDLEKLPE